MDDWYSQSLEQKKTWYNADAYYQARPSYPPQLIDRAISLAGLAAGARLLEIGCGPATATVPLARRGFSVVGLEINPDSAQLAAQLCHPFPQVKIINTAFETWPGGQFDAIVAATSFHWLDEQISYAKAAATIKNGGPLILLWNTEPQLPPQIHQSLNDLYLSYGLGLHHDLTARESLIHSLGQRVVASGYFCNLIMEKTITPVSYDLDRYMMLLTTLSPYIALAQRDREELLQKLRSRLQKIWSGEVTLHYLSALQIAWPVPR